jgi:hypothetical protein
MCGGTCVTVVDNPQHCGGCSVTCSTGQVCSGRSCTAGGASSCLPGSGQTVCNGQCVDLSTNNDNCGACGSPCNGANQGCVGGHCGPATVFPPPASCAGGGPAVTIGTGTTARCAGAVAQTTFTWGVCSCRNVSFEDNALIDGFDSTKGAYVPNQLGGGLGADGTISNQSVADVWGQGWAGSTATSWMIGQFNVHHDMHSGGDVSGDTMSVTKDAYVAGNINASMTVGGTLYQTPNKASGGLNPMPLPGPVGLPCACASPIPVTDLVAWAKTNNNNAAIGLDPGIMSQAGHPSRIDLPCGVYYMSGFSSGGTIVAHGNTALFIDGSVSSSADLTMTVADAASAFDIFVGGTITATSSFKLGDPKYPALTRLYIGGTQTLDVQSALIIGAEIWAGNATVLWESDTDAFGSIFAGDLQVVSRLNLHADQGVLGAGNGCPPPGGGGGGGAGGSGGGCTTCQDCGNQACVNGTCGQCTTNADCCPPLVCINGTCQGTLIVP